MSSSVRIYYDLEIRRFSSNVVVRVDVILNNKGKEELHKTIICVPTLKKEEGDILAEFMKNQLNGFNN